MGGRPGWPALDFHRQYSWNPFRCHWMTVSGCTMARAERQFGQHALHLRRRLLTVARQKVRRVLPQQVAYVEGFAGSLGGWSARAGCGFRGEPLFADTLDDGP